MENYVSAAEQFLGAVRTDESAAAHIERLGAGCSSELETELADDQTKRAFWLNLYNAIAHYELGNDPAQWKHRNLFFYRRRFTLAGVPVSLHKIEHGMLRHSQLSWGFGYLPNLFPGRFEKRFRVSERDPRIHFALNCGAASCPPIKAYTPEEIDMQLSAAAERYLSQEVIYAEKKNTVRVPRTFLWFYGDFGGHAGIRDMLEQYEVIPVDMRPLIRFKSYDWSLELES